MKLDLSQQEKPQPHPCGVHFGQEKNFLTGNLPFGPARRSTAYAEQPHSGGHLKAQGFCHGVYRMMRTGSVIPWCESLGGIPGCGLRGDIVESRSRCKICGDWPGCLTWRWWRGATKICGTPDSGWLGGLLGGELCYVASYVAADNAADRMTAEISVDDVAAELEADHVEKCVAADKAMPIGLAVHFKIVSSNMVTSLLLVP